MLQDLLMNMSANSDKIGTIRNPIPNTEGKFTVDYSDGTSGIVYGRVDANGDQWLLVYQYTNTPVVRTWIDLVVKDMNINSFSQDPTNYPVIKSGIKNKSTKVRFKNLNPNWITYYVGSYITFDTVPQNTILGVNGYPAKRENGSPISIYPESAGWYYEINVNDGAVFYIWTQWGAGGPCGGAGISGSTKICPATGPSLTNHCDYTSYSKELFLKVN